MSSYNTFSQLHQQSSPLLLGNVWDVNSAQIFEANGYKAIGISSQAASNAQGYKDGENLPFENLLRLAERIVEVVRIPFTVDMEAGYSRTIDGIIRHIDQLHDAGVAGINLEDTIAGKLQPVADFQQILSAVAEHISSRNLQLFLNIRTDGFLLGMPTALTETLTRIKSYENAGADGIFVPCITDTNDIKAVVQATHLPINVMCMPALPDFPTLATLGVKRISMGGFFFNKIYANATKLAKTILHDNNFTSIF